ncbi:MAG: stage III sporulation protein AF [Oscillibacter sp.]|jgi:stage III sporulation protein AF|nr:stage III sporulation protein AF [Oscillibacter sp.]
MIAGVRSWLTSITAVTLMLTVVQTLVPEGTLRKITGFTGGLLLLAALLQPVLRTDLGGLRLDLSGYGGAIEERWAELYTAGKEELAAIIAERTAAYISDKADALGLEVTVRVETEPGEEGTPLPVSAELEGSYSQDLADWIAGELGIPAERQVWHEGKN